MNSEKNISSLLGIVQLFVALLAIPSGILMLLEPDGSGLGLSLDILQDSPFTNFIIPGLFLLTVNGIAQGFAAFSSFRQFSYYRTLGFILGIILVLWIMVQIFHIGLTHFLQVIFFFIGIAEVILSVYLLNTKKI